MTDKPALTSADLVVGGTYRAKRPRKTILGDYNDRTILWKGMYEVQYDGPAVNLGHHYPRVTFAAFLKWAGERVD